LPSLVIIEWLGIKGYPMKIGIVTLWISKDNYGQQLQCFALQQYLRNLGHEPFLIRYNDEAARFHKAKVFARKVLHAYKIHKIFIPGWLKGKCLKHIRGV